MKKILILMMVVVLAFTVIACGAENAEANNTVNQNNAVNENTNNVEDNTTSTDTPEIVIVEPKDTIEVEANHPTVTLEFEAFGTIILELYPELAPNTVNNFITLINDGYYDGLKFHRVIPGFMIQGGDPVGNGTGGPGYSIDAEFSATDEIFTKYLSHTRGVISMARSQDPNSAGSQFFIMHQNSTNLDLQYASFGQVISGLEVVDAVTLVETGEADNPLEDVLIKSITVELNGYELQAPITNN